MDDGDIEVSLVSNVLTVRGEKKTEAEEKDAGYYHSERHFGSFERSFRLPDDTNLKKISARLDKGLLTIILPKVAGAVTEPRKIKVKKK